MSNDVLWTELVRNPEDFAGFDPLLLHDMLCAIRSVENYYQDLYLDDFGIFWEGEVSVTEVYDYDDGVDKWLSLNSDSSFEDLSKFRGYKWLLKSQTWLKDGIPPVIAITVKDVTQIGDGRGRINLANMYSLPIPLYHIKYYE